MILHFYILLINTYTFHRGRRALVFAVLNGKISSRYIRFQVVKNLIPFNMQYSILIIDFVSFMLFSIIVIFKLFFYSLIIRESSLLSFLCII